MAREMKHNDLEQAIIEARNDAKNESEVDDLVNVLENQLDYLYHFHEFKTDGRKTTEF